MTASQTNTGTLFERLRTACADEWRAYVEHPFVRGLADGTLPEACFRYYLVQDYLFLIHFARAQGLAAYKGETLDDVRRAAAALSTVVEVEMDLHVEYCAGWGLSVAELEAAEADPATAAYGDYVLARGLAGDLLDLHVALAPCVVGYGEIGAALAADPATLGAGNPYRDWIEMYAGADYQAVAGAELATLDALAARAATEARMAELIACFREATRLEAAFWEMGLRARAVPL